MRIEKENIVIRSATVDDAKQLNQWWNDEIVMEHAGFPNGIGESLEDTIGNIKNWEGKLSQLCVIEVDRKPIGELSYRIKGDGAAYPGWKICDFSFQNQGYGPKIIIMLLRFLFTDEAINSKFPIEKIVWDTSFENKRAQHVYETKIGAKKIGMRENAWQDQSGNWRSAVDYEISREEFFSKGIKLDKIIIKEDVIPRIEELMNLYNDVEWLAYTNDSVRLKDAIENSLKVFTAWDGEKLVGLIRVIGDNHTIIYIQDILVLQEYQGQGIGNNLLKLVLEKYKSIRQIVLMTDDTEKTINFYKKSGMVRASDYNCIAFMN